MFDRYYYHLTIVLFCTVTFLSLRVEAETAQDIYANYQDRIFQIRLIELSSGSKAAIGSGFQVNAEGLVATNYHVVAEAVQQPEKYRLEFVDTDGQRGDLALVDIDVVLDLALVRHKEINRHQYLPMAPGLVAQGEDLFSMGNPHDLGMTVVKGTFNGLLEHSFYERILLSGSINPGMSGGPTLNRKGEVVGVNVATAGNQLSFLVPVKQLRSLMSRQQNPNNQKRPLKQRITSQLLKNQQELMEVLLATQWPLIDLGGVQVAGEIAQFTRCWGGSDDEEKARYTMYYSRCFSEDTLYLTSGFSTGLVNYEFYWLESNELNPWQFYNRFQESMTGAMPINTAPGSQVGNFNCHNDFVSWEVNSQWKAVVCARQYKHYPGLYDLMFIAATVDKSRKGLISHFALAGVSKDLGMKFTRKFMEHVRWK